MLYERCVIHFGRQTGRNETKSDKRAFRGRAAAESSPTGAGGSEGGGGGDGGG